MQAQIDTMRLEIKQLFTRADDVGSDMERCRQEMKDVYRLFTENDQKIINDYLKNKVQMDSEIAQFKTRVGFFDSEMENMKNTLTEHNIVVENSKTLVNSVQEEITRVKKACMEIATKSARQQSLNESIDKTREMCDRFNRAALDLRNQLDTTDMYIEHYLPFRTIKEIGYMLHNSFEEKIANKVKIFESKRI